MKTGLVKVLLVFLTAIVVCKDFTESGIHLRIDVAVRLNLSLDFVEDLQTVMVKTQI